MRTARRHSVPKPQRTPPLRGSAGAAPVSLLLAVRKHPLFALLVGGLVGVSTTLIGAALSKSRVDQYWR